MSKSYDIPRTSQSYTLEEADAAIEALRGALRDIEHYAELGLNSGKPEHLEAALFDILEAVRTA